MLFKSKKDFSSLKTGKDEKRVVSFDSRRSMIERISLSGILFYNLHSMQILWSFEV